MTMITVGASAARRAPRTDDATRTAWFACASAAAMVTIVAASVLAGGRVDSLDAVLLLRLRDLVVGQGAVAGGIRETMLAVTGLGAFPTLCLVLIWAAGLLASVGERTAALRLLVEALTGIAIANLLKHVVDRPRPALVEHWANVASSSFPSSHSADGAIVYSLVAAMLAGQLGSSRTVGFARRSALAVVVAIGASRVYLGVHWPTDVLGGWAFGAAWVHLCERGRRPVAAATFGRLATFEDVLVHPTQALLRPPWMLFRGGPDWPGFWTRRRARQCRFSPAIPLDVRPRPAPSAAAARYLSGIWCGPVSQHFGHAVASLGSRIASASRRLDAPLVFSALPSERPPPFFWQMLAHFGVSPERVRIVTTPTRFERLSVLPEAEPPLGAGPDPAYLDLLDDIAGPRAIADGSRLYVSRAAMWKGKVAGELYVEEAMERAGYRAFRPEAFTIDEQLDAYRRASRLVFAEGSAVHALQLLGRVGADVVVVARRPGSRLARTALRPRVASLRYVDAVRQAAARAAVRPAPARRWLPRRQPSRRRPRGTPSCPCRPA